MESHTLRKTLEILSLRRPVFHSEADFQHELAIELNKNGYKVRLEVPRTVSIKGVPVAVEIDLLVKSEIWTAIELKYVKQRAEIEYDGESFNLLNSWGTNLSRFDCLSDLQRVEALVAAGDVKKGFTIFLSNVNKAWEVDNSRNQNLARNFSIHDGRDLKAGFELNWHPEKPPAGSVTQKRLYPFSPIVLTNAQKCMWRDYSDLGQRGGKFKYLMLET